MLGSILTTVSFVPILSVSMRDPELCFFVLGARGGTSLHVEQLSSATLELDPATLNFFRLPVASDPFEDEQCGGSRGTLSCKSRLEPEGRFPKPLLPGSEDAISGQPPMFIHSWILEQFFCFTFGTTTPCLELNRCLKSVSSNISCVF